VSGGQEQPRVSSRQPRGAIFLARRCEAITPLGRANRRSSCCVGNRTGDRGNFRPSDNTSRSLCVVVAIVLGRRFSQPSLLMSGPGPTIWPPSIPLSSICACNCSQQHVVGGYATDSPHSSWKTRGSTFVAPAGERSRLRRSSWLNTALPATAGWRNSSASLSCFSAY
jgi:hypothetical protein